MPPPSEPWSTTTVTPVAPEQAAAAAGGAVATPPMSPPVAAAMPREAARRGGGAGPPPADEPAGRGAHHARGVPRSEASCPETAHRQRVTRKVAVPTRFLNSPTTFSLWVPTANLATKCPLKTPDLLALPLSTSLPSTNSLTFSLAPSLVSFTETLPPFLTVLAILGFSRSLPSTWTSSEAEPGPVVAETVTSLLFLATPSR